MRRFTKEHNDLDWLYPDMTNSRTSEECFEDYEDTAKILKYLCYRDQKTFDGDDMIDAFMKGASVAHQLLNSDFSTYYQMMINCGNPEFQNHIENTLEISLDIIRLYQENVEQLEKEIKNLKNNGNLTSE